MIPVGAIPVLPLKNTVIYPGITQTLLVGREKSIKALEKAQNNNFWIIAIAQKDPEQSIRNVDDIHEIGTLSKIESSRRHQDGSYSVVVRGYHRVRIPQFEPESPIFEAYPEQVDDVVDIDPTTQQALAASVKQLSREVLELVPANTDQVLELIQGIEDLSYLVHLCASNADFPLSEKQKLLEMINVRERTMRLLQLMQEFKENLKVQQEIRQRLNTNLGQNQREHILREQLKAIKEELGEDGGSDKLADSLRTKINTIGLSTEAMELAKNQLRRLEETNTSSPEYQIIRNHLELLVALPWNKSSERSEIDLAYAQKVLDEDHYGLDKIKKRIVQHLAVLKLKKDKRGSILLFIGPPGVGKTSLGQSIAKALGKKYSRISLGGVRDEAEIRGHRRTYIGALPGRIINGLKKAGENDPVMVLDEIDKMSRSFAGDPASAMLEVLDPEQNSSFNDNYLDVGFDLSKVFFIATANSLEGIPGPLLDRMEVIDLSGYTTSEKFHIAKSHLIPKQMTEHGLTSEQLTISDEALHKLITSYTREAGVRELQRMIAQSIRHMSADVLAKGTARFELSHIEEALGPEKYTYDLVDNLSVPGVVTGLAWTPVGGDILFLETALLPGKGDLIITGQLGDVMKESAQIAKTLVKARLAAIAPTLDMSKYDIHLHIPAGAIPKDGPSAGVTLLTCLASLVSKQAVDPKLAMTGEISLRGTVMPVGGIKEKVMAAHRAGVRKIILSKRNQKDLRDVPDEVKSQIEFIFVEHINEVLRNALNLDLSHFDLNNVLAGQPPPTANA